MPKKIQNFAKSALVKPITINVGRAGAASLDVIQVRLFHSESLSLRGFRLKIRVRIFHKFNLFMRVQEVEYVKEEAKMVYLLECLQKTPPPVSTYRDSCTSYDTDVPKIRKTERVPNPPPL